MKKGLRLVIYAYIYDIYTKATAKHVFWLVQKGSHMIVKMT